MLFARGYLLVLISTSLSFSGATTQSSPSSSALLPVDGISSKAGALDSGPSPSASDIQPASSGYSLTVNVVPDQAYNASTVQTTQEGADTTGPLLSESSSTTISTGSPSSSSNTSLPTTSSTYPVSSTSSSTTTPDPTVQSSSWSAKASTSNTESPSKPQSSDVMTVATASSSTADTTTSSQSRSESGSSSTLLTSMTGPDVLASHKSSSHSTSTAPISMSLGSAPSSGSSVHPSAATRTVHPSSKRWIIAVVVLAISVALIVFLTMIWWLRKFYHRSSRGSGSFNDDWTLRESIATSAGSNETHANVRSPSIMCVGERESTFGPLLASAHAPLSINTSVERREVVGSEPCEGPLGCLTVPQDRALLSLSQISGGSAWDVQGSATAAVLSGNRFSSPIPTTPAEAHVAPSSTTLLWHQRASVALEQGLDVDVAPVQAMRQKSTHNPFRGANKLQPTAYAEYPARSETAPPMLTAQRTINNPFRRPSGTQARLPGVSSFVQPDCDAGSAALSMPLHVEVAQPSPRQWHATSEPSPWMVTQAEVTRAEIARTKNLQVPQTSWSTESPTQTSMNSMWPAMPPEASQRGYYSGVTPSPEPGPEVAFYNAI